ncbi:MAG TPA: S-methyl-5-thioribose-1-phosphate isomerase [Bacilli bacterium]
MPNDAVQSVRFDGQKLIILDQTQLPLAETYIEITTVKGVWEAIKELKVRGAPAIGIAAAYGLLLGIKDAPETGFAEFYRALEEHADYLATSRPTAVNLFWALNRMKDCAKNAKDLPVPRIKAILQKEAHAIRDEDEAVCRAIGEHALTLFPQEVHVLTHCNAGGIATAKYGTALAPLFLAHEQGRSVRVFADETRPLLQGARLTTWELQRAGIDVTLIADNMAAYVMQKGWVQAVIVGCDRVAANGDTANKIGTYGLALLAKAHRIPFYVAAPLSTVDMSIASGAEIPIEERKAEEITQGFGKQTAPVGTKVFNPAFDVTPHELITAIITEKGVIRPPYMGALAAAKSGGR